MRGIVNFTLLFAKYFCGPIRYFVLCSEIQVTTWKQFDPFGSYTYHCWLSLKKCSLSANYSQPLRQDILKYSIEMLWIMSFQSGSWEQILFMTLYKHMQCSLYSFWMILYQVLINSLMCLYYAKGSKKTLKICGALCVSPSSLELYLVLPKHSLSLQEICQALP